MRANWFGLAEERVHRLLGRISGSEIISGIPGSATDHHAAPYSITEEFVAVYRMHPLMPDEFDLRSTADPHRVERREFLDLAGLRSRDVVAASGRLRPALLPRHRAPGRRHPAQPPPVHAAVPPRRRMEIDLAAVDILRSRERGVPRYNRFRRLLSLPEARSFEDLDEGRRRPPPSWPRCTTRSRTSTSRWACTPSRRPAGFGFSDTAFRIFILMASRRLKSDRFFTTDFTPAGLHARGDALDRRQRHVVGAGPALPRPRAGAARRGNAFAPWPVLGRTPEVGHDHRAAAAGRPGPRAGRAGPTADPPARDRPGRPAHASC